LVLELAPELQGYRIPTLTTDLPVSSSEQALGIPDDDTDRFLSELAIQILHFMQENGKELTTTKEKEVDEFFCALVSGLRILNWVGDNSPDAVFQILEDEQSLNDFFDVFNTIDESRVNRDSHKALFFRMWEVWIKAPEAAKIFAESPRIRKFWNVWINLNPENVQFNNFLLNTFYRIALTFCQVSESFCKQTIEHNNFVWGIRYILFGDYLEFWQREACSTFQQLLNHLLHIPEFQEKFPELLVQYGIIIHKPDQTWPNDHLHWDNVFGYLELILTPANQEFHSSFLSTIGFSGILRMISQMKKPLSPHQLNRYNELVCLALQVLELNQEHLEHNQSPIEEIRKKLVHFTQIIEKHPDLAPPIMKALALIEKLYPKPQEVESH